MTSRIRVYVGSVAIAAIGASIAVYVGIPVSGTPMLADALFLCALALAGEMLGFILPTRAIGSMGFIPIFAAAILVPAWPSVFGVIVLRVGLELLNPRETIKKTLNVASHVLMVIIAISVYRLLGGVGLLRLAGGASLTHLTQQYGLPAIIAFNVALLANHAIVYLAIAFATGRSFKAVWLENSRSTFIVDILTTPLIFVFAWVYGAFGPLAAGAFWVPILGLRQVQRVNLELERTNEELLELMVKSLEARDPYTSGHSRRVQHYSIVIARAMGLPERSIAEIGRAALLHDVGKIYEKYASVLAKQDKLTPEEWTIIQEHPDDGAKLVATMTRLRDIVPAIRHHHENWDGTGYPHGLAGEFIPLASRIIRFADTIDAMTTERPYRRPLTEPEVRSEVVRWRGVQFDPSIADRLLSSALWPSLFSSPSIGEATQPARFALIGGRRRPELTREVRSANGG
jgi:putative nucleotidyltransferase with HDIG domain